MSFHAPTKLYIVSAEDRANAFIVASSAIGAVCRYLRPLLRKRVQWIPDKILLSRAVHGNKPYLAGSVEISTRDFLLQLPTGRREIKPQAPAIPEPAETDLLAIQRPTVKFLAHRQSKQAQANRQLTEEEREAVTRQRRAITEEQIGGFYEEPTTERHLRHNVSLLNERLRQVREARGDVPVDLKYDHSADGLASA